MKFRILHNEKENYYIPQVYDLFHQQWCSIMYQKINEETWFTISLSEFTFQKFASYQEAYLIATAYYSKKCIYKDDMSPGWSQTVFEL